MKGLLVHCAALYRCDGSGPQGEMEVVPRGAVAWDDRGIIEWIGQECNVPTKYRAYPTVDAKGGIVVPGLIDCHTHLAFGGWRSDEFEERILGKTYSSLLQEGRGILSTVAATRALTERELVERSSAFLREMAALGVTTVEAKSGYGLTVDDELKLLRVYKVLNREQSISVLPTFLGAHSIPPEYEDKRSEYVRLIVDVMLPRVQKEMLARWVDVFVDDDAFSIEEATTIIEAGRKRGMPPRLHVDQLRNGKGAEFAAASGALSADHLDHVSDAGIRALADKNVIAVLLPLATIMVRQPLLDARSLFKAGVKVAVATDFNPGSAPSAHLPLSMSLACVVHRMTPREVLDGVTRIAALSLAEKKRGSLHVGYEADIAVIDAPSVEHWMYNFRERRCHLTIKSGVTIWSNG